MQTFTRRYHLGLDYSNNIAFKSFLTSWSIDAPPSSAIMTTCVQLHSILLAAIGWGCRSVNWRLRRGRGSIWIFLAGQSESLRTTACCWCVSPNVRETWSVFSAHARRTEGNEGTMKRTSSLSASRDMRSEYRFGYRKARPNRFAGRVGKSRVVVVLDPDISKVFTTPQSVNAALRALITAMPKAHRQKVHN